MSSDKYFLLVRDNLHGRTQVEQFADDEAAFAAYFDAEREYDVAHSEAESADVEVVLISAESEQSVREGYPHYFTEGSRDERRAGFAQQVKGLLEFA